jgi:general secretion pathway protein H
MLERDLGFTLIELVVALGIGALLLTIAAPHFVGGKGRAQLSAAAHDLAAGLRETRSRAIRLNRPQHFVIDTENGIYKLGGAPQPRKLPNGMRLTVYTTSDLRIAEAAGAIQFFPDGSSSGGGLTLMLKEQRSEILVDWLTGRVSVGDERAGAGR